MVKGGYQIINFNGVEFIKDTSKQLSNIYDKIEGTDKAILLSGLNVNGVDYRDVFVTPIVIGDSYVIKVYGLRIYISDVDIVTVEDEIFFIEGVDLSIDTSYIVSDYIYRALYDCVDGDFRTFKFIYGRDYVYVTIISANHATDELYCIVGDFIKCINLASKNNIDVRGF